MIDANRLSQSLATALKDRPHGIPVQLNRSLPLRPAPPLPIRKSVPKCPENSPQNSTVTTKALEEQNESRNGRDSVIRERDTSQNSDSVSRINFYDSANEKDLISNDESVGTAGKISRRDSGELVKVRATKSLGNEDYDKFTRNEKRRKSWQCDGDGHDKKRSNSNSEQAEVLDNKRADVGIRKRKSTGAKEDRQEAVSRQVKVAKIQNTDELITETKADNNLQKVNSSGTVFPNILRYRVSETNDSSGNKTVTEKSEKPEYKSSDNFEPILPEPQYLPECPCAVPIAVAHAINQNDFLNSKNNIKTNDTDILKSRTVNDALVNHQPDSINPKIMIDTISTEDSYTLRIAELLSPSLPSMPNLEDGQIDPFGGMLTLQKEKINSDEDGSALLSESAIKIAEKVLQKENEMEESEVKETIVDASRLTEIENLDQPQANETILDIPTLYYEIQISTGDSSEVIILRAPKLVADEELDIRIADNIPVEATTPSVSLPSSDQPALDELRNNEEIESIGASNKLIEIGEENVQDYATSMSNDCREEIPDILVKNDPLDLRNVATSLGAEEPREEAKKVASESPEISQKHQRRTKEAESIARCRKNRLEKKLQKLYEEEIHLKNKLSQASDPPRLTRLRQKVSCTEKKIENTKKYLEKLSGTDRVTSRGNSHVSRIQVRRDLVEQIVSPESEEPFSKSSLQLNHKIDETSRVKTPPEVITISESDSSLSSDEISEENSDAMPCNDSDEGSVRRGDEMKCDVKNAVESEGITSEIPREDRSENSDETVAENAENDEVPLNGNEQERSTNATDQSAVPDAQTVEQPDASYAAPETTNNNNVEIADENLTQSLQSSPAVANEPSKSTPPFEEPIALSTNPTSPVYANDKLPNAQPLGAPSFNACNCVRCSRTGIPTPANQIVASPVADNFIPTTVTEQINGIPNRQTVVQENLNVYPVPNYPVHRTDYRTTNGGVSGRFSRENGGANSNLSSPLQGHSALPLPPPYSRNLTAQGYSPPTEITQNHHQTVQWYHTQHPASRTSSAQLTTVDQDGEKLHSPILAAHLLMPHIQEPANLSRSSKNTSPQRNNETHQINYEQNIAARIITEPFPTFGNWAATQMNGKSSVGIPNSNTVIEPAGYNSSGSDLYKMAAMAVDVTTHSSLPETSPSIWGAGRPAAYPAEQQRIMVPGLQDPRNNPNLYPREYPLITAQNYHLHYQKNVYIKPGYAGSELITPYIAQAPRRQDNHNHQVPSGGQTVQNSSGQSAVEYSSGQQKAWQYQQVPQTSSLPRAWLGSGNNNNNNYNNNNHGNLIGMPPQQYLQQQSQQQQQQQSLVQLAPPPPPPPPYRQIQPRQTRIPASKKNQRNTNASVNRRNKQSENSASYQQQSMNRVAQLQQQRGNGANNNNNINNNVLLTDTRLPNPIQNIISPVYSAVVQHQRAAEPTDISRSSAANNFGIFYPDYGIILQSNGLKCLRCGTAAPKFNCADCEAAFYCNEYCQRDHWATHSLECRKKMPKLKKVN